MNDATLAFIHRHRTDDVHSLALKAHGHDDVDLPMALQQIAGWQTARRKLPSWACIDGLHYPPHLSMEQCSSEDTARYKTRLVERLLATQNDATEGEEPTLTDLTGGFGVDFSFMAKGFKRAVYVEQQDALCQLARHNFPLLGLSHAEVCCSDAETYLQQMDKSTVIFMDPARRDAHGQRTFAIADCTPDAARLKDLLMQKAQWVVLKLSPMLDWHKAVADLQPYVCEVHIVAVANECRELLLVLCQHPAAPLEVFCVNDAHLFRFSPSSPASSPVNCGSAAVPDPPSPLYLYEPNAAIMKAGCFAHLSQAFRLQPLSPNSHLFLSPTLSDAFPGRRFTVLSVCSLNKKQLRQALQDIDRANIAVRNFPLTAPELRRRLRLADGGPTYIFGTTDAQGQHCLFICTKM